MSLTSVKISEEVWMTCLTHALSTEKEEIMGLLLGDILPSEDGGEEALIWGASPQPRCDRQKDRVETNPEQLVAASIQAEKITTETGRKTRVIGWYHSHPKITVLPSHVDLRTQAMYQQLDSGFIGLIFSCFSEDAHKVGRIQVIAFQSLDGKQSQILRAVPSSPVYQDPNANLSLSVSSSENIYTGFGLAGYESFDQDTTDSKAIAVHSKANRESSDVGVVAAKYSAKKKNGRKKKKAGRYQVRSDMSDSMEEALLRSELEVSAAEFTRKEIPLHVLPDLSLLKLDSPSSSFSPLASFVDLQRMLFEEEQAAYHQAILQSTREGKVDPLTFIHQKTTYEASLYKLMEYCLIPAIKVLEDRKREYESQSSFLQSEHHVLSQKANTSASIEANKDEGEHKANTSASIEANKDEGEQGARKMITWQRRKHKSTNLTLEFLSTIDMEKLLTSCSKDDKDK